MQPRPPISAQRSLKAPHANNFLALPTNCCLEVNLHLYQLQCLLKKLPDLFNQFFLDKVENIRDQFDCNTPVNSPSPFNYVQFFMTLLLRLSSQSLQTHYGLYSRNLRPNHVLLTQSQHHYCLNALTQSCQY